MKKCFVKSCSVGLLSVALLVVAGNQQARAQSTEPNPVVVNDRTEDELSWGLLGLLGLLGLGGLMRRDDNHSNRRDGVTTADARTTRT